MSPVSTIARLLLCLCLIAGGVLQAVATTRMAMHEHAGAPGTTHVAAHGDVAAATPARHHDTAKAVPCPDTGDAAPGPDCCEDSGCRCDCGCPQSPVALPAFAHAASSVSDGVPAIRTSAPALRAPSRLIRPPIG